jgi:hypothetical protein
VLEEIILKNFQKHKNRKFKLSRITVFSGKTNAGKSAVIRALGLACLNRWAKCYLRHGKDAVSVLLRADGRKVFRKKGGRLNLYSLDGKRFKAFGSSVPAEVAQFLNIGPENFQRQTDPHFWFADTPGQVSKHLNKIVNLDKIDRTLARIGKKVSSATARVGVGKDRLRAVKEKVKSLEWTKDFCRAAERVLAAGALARQSRLASRQLADLVRGASRYALEADSLTGATLGALNAIEAGAKATAARDRADRLKRLLAELTTAEAHAAVEMPDLTGLKSVRDKMEELTKDRYDLEELVTELAHAEKDLCTAEAGLKKAGRTLAAKTPKNCPTCGRKLNGRSLPSPPGTSTCGTSHRYAGSRKGPDGTG